ncbi:hypothetical protein [Cohnella sp. REN36]|uniref:hypothetical protein n=1 Tax=Cohnella sp. REN36 TaxID=2887347 RepID=UPI001D133C17|nr:hypothetical protein [Cohnella sp. REN36]MCC3377168.1 hypothetical protein [Cohnella sp. REN36]
MKNRHPMTKKPLRTGRPRVLTAAAAAALLLLAGCGTGSGSDTSASPSPSASASASSAAPSGEASPSAPASTPPASNNPYETAGVEDPAAFDRMFADVQAAVAADDAEKVAEYILFPLAVNHDGESVQVKTKEAFIKQCADIFTDNVKQALASQKKEDLFVNFKGVMVGDGAIWFGATADQPQRLGVIAVNVDAGKS